MHHHRRTTDATRRRPALAALVASIAIALLAAGCGTQLDAKQRAAYLQQTGGGGARAAGSTGGGGTGDGTTDALGTGDTTTGGQAIDPATGAPTDAGGTTGSGGGQTSSGGGTTGTTVKGGSTATTAKAVAATGLPCSQPSKEIGVTDKMITIGGVFQQSGPVTGFADQFLAGVRAKVAQVNAQGGICGRKVEYLNRDDGFDASKNASLTKELMGKVTSIVGGFSTVDAGGASVMKGTNMPDIATSGSPDRDANAGHVGMTYFPNGTDALPEFKYFKSQGASKVALVYVSLATARTLADIYAKKIEAAGMTVVKRIELATTQFSYDGTAQDVGNSGADTMFFLHETNAAVSMTKALQKAKVNLKFPYFSAFSYSQKYIDLAGSASEGVVTVLPFIPYEEAGSNKPTATMLQWLDQVAPGSSPTFDAASGWSVAELFFDSLKKLSGPITRDGIIAAAKSTADFNASGVWGPSHPNNKASVPCTIIMRVKGGKFTREAPASGFSC